MKNNELQISSTENLSVEYVFASSDTQDETMKTKGKGYKVNIISSTQGTDCKKGQCM